MKKIVIVLSALTLLFSGSGCIKDDGCKDQTIASEEAAMNAHATSIGMIATKHPSGVLYEIITPGTGTMPTLVDNVTVKYTGKLLNGTVFDAPANPITFSVPGTIPGFQVALQLLKEGGKIKVIIPSALAYGCGGRGAIPSSAILYFEIELIDVI